MPLSSLRFPFSFSRCPSWGDPTVLSLCNVLTISLRGLPAASTQSQPIEVDLVYCELEILFYDMQTMDLAFMIRQAMQRVYSDCPMESVGSPTSGSLKLLSQDSEWPVIEWLENDTNKVIAVFNTDGNNLPCSRVGIWRIGAQSKLIWEVEDIEVFNTALPKLQLAVRDNVDHLKMLFGAGQHMTNILSWDPKDIM